MQDITQALKALEPTLHSAMQAQQLPGLALAIVKDDEVAFAGGFGKCQAEGAPIDENTIFAIGKFRRRHL